MASYNQNTIIFTLISLLCLISITSTHAGDNDTLVDVMCGATYAPNVCQACIKADHLGAHIDQDVIQAMLKCGDDDALKLEADVTKVLDDPNTDPTTRSTLFSINPTIQAIIGNGGIVQQQAFERKFADARSTISTLIIPKLGECNTALNASGIVIPPPVFSGFFNVEADYKLSDQLMATVKN